MRCLHHLPILLLGSYLYLGLLIRGELYAPPVELSRWSSIVNKTTDLLETSIRIEEEKLIKLYEIQELIRELSLQEGKPRIDTIEIESSSRKNKSLIEAFMEHPIRAFIVLNRFFKANYLIMSNLGHDDDDDRFERMSDDSLPSNDDLVGCGRALLRLQTFYGLDIDDVIRGDIGYTQNQEGMWSDKPVMGPSECYEIGKIAYGDGDYSMAIGWFQKSYELYNGDKLLELNELLEYMAFAAYQNHQIKYATELTKLWLEREPSNERAIYNLEYYEDELKQYRNNKMDELSNSELILSDDGNSSKPNDSRATQSSYADRYSPGTVFTYGDYDFTKDDVVRHLCTRTNDDTENNGHRSLTCTKKLIMSIDHHISPELKIEMMNESPKIIRIYDFVTETEARQLRQMASTKLEHSTVQTKQGSLVSPDFRVAKTAWLSRKTSDEIVGRLERRIEQILGIDLSDSEDLQVVNYGAGGFYGPHLDSKRETSQAEQQEQKQKHLGEAKRMEQVIEMVLNSTKDSGVENKSRLKENDRLATVLIYLNHVQAGGSTVFSKLNLTVRPIERSAVVWFNLMRNGYSDERTLHAGCPVLLGFKWIATKWPREAGNTFLRPCGLRSTD